MMKVKMFKGINLLATDKDFDNLKNMCSEAEHERLTLSEILETDSKGRITFFMPNSGIKWSLIFYLQNLMIRQRLFEMDAFLDSRK